MPDSIQHTIDSVSLLKNDSTFLLDSLQRADSLLRADSVSKVLPVPSGFEGMIHPSLPATESWVFIVLVALFLLLVGGIVRSAGEFLQNIKIFFSRKEQVNLMQQSQTVNIVQFQIFITIFSLSVIALTVNEIFFASSDKFKFLTFAQFLGVTAAFYLLKHILFEMVGHTFFNAKVTKVYKNMYFSLLNMLTVVLFPILILYTFQPVSWQYYLSIISVSLVGIFYIFLIIKLFQYFYSKQLDLFYIFLYLCTLEIIPVLILIRAYNFVK